ncbi:MAG: cadherin-like domain-containing protein, partial [Pseudomonadota bacterium]
ALTFSAAELLANDSDPNGDTLTITGLGTPTQGALVDNGDGTYTYTPGTGFEGADSFTYTLSDGTNQTTANVTVNVGDFGALSDDFAGGSIDPVWRFDGIAGGVNIGYSGNDAFATLTSPEGVKVSASDVLTTPRLMQSVNDLDFQISAGFLNEPSQQFQENGLLVVQDDANWIRFDLAYTGSTLSLIVGVIENGSTTYPLFQSIGSGAVSDFRITRTGDDWTFEYKSGSGDWIQAYSLNHAMSVSEVGVFAGSTSYGPDVPGFVAHVDYFENSQAPLTNEDGGYVPVNHAPVANDDIFDFAGARTFDPSELLANDTDSDVNDVLSMSGFTQPAYGSLVQNPDGTLTYTPAADFEGADYFTYTLSDGNGTDAATVTLNVKRPIDVWYGDTQTFGASGEGQQWVNILGNVAPDVVALSYTLNGGANRTLSIGPDTRRLQENGDFNIDIDFADLDGSSVDDVVSINALLDNGETVTRDVTIVYESGTAWDPNYSIDWSSVSDIQDAVQVVDGTWEITPDGARPVDLGYDRLIVLGDNSWDNYQVDLTITMHDLENVDPLGRDGGAFAIGMLWGGHTDDPIPDLQPTSGFNPGASFFYTGRLEAHSYHNFFEYLGVAPFTFVEGLTYNVTVQVTQGGLYDRNYALKVWEEGAAEPVGWNLYRTEVFTLDEAPATGGIYLNAHYYDVSFGDLSVTEITGRDIVNGGDGADLLVAVDSTDVLPGAGEVDVFAGYAGADTYVFGDNSKVYYDDGIANSAGETDYAFVWDFDVSEDTIQLHGSAADYSLTLNAGGLPSGMAIYKIDGTTNELIAILNGVDNLSLDGGNFSFVDDLIS